MQDSGKVVIPNGSVVSYRSLQSQPRSLGDVQQVGEKCRRFHGFELFGSALRHVADCEPGSVVVCFTPTRSMVAPRAGEDGPEIRFGRRLFRVGERAEVPTQAAHEIQRYRQHGGLRDPRAGREVETHKTDGCLSVKAFGVTELAVVNMGHAVVRATL